MLSCVLQEKIFLAHAQFRFKSLSKFLRSFLTAHAQFRCWSCPNLSYLILACHMLSWVLKGKYIAAYAQLKFEFLSRPVRFFLTTHAQFIFCPCPSLSYLVIACPVLSFVLEKKIYFCACAAWMLVLSLLVIFCHSLSYVVLCFTRKRYFLRMLSSHLSACPNLSDLSLLRMLSSHFALVLGCPILS